MSLPCERLSPWCEQGRPWEDMIQESSPIVTEDKVARGVGGEKASGIKRRAEPNAIYL